MKRLHSIGRYLFCIVLSGLIGLAGCGKPTPKNGGGGDWPTSAIVAEAIKETVLDNVELLATLQSRDNVTLISELDATVKEILFLEGDATQTDNLLFRLDDIRTQARLTEAEATYRLAELSYNRSSTLLKNKTISQQEYDQTEAEYFSRKAALALATEDQAKTRIRAPFPGRMGERLVSPGQFVARGQILGELTRTDPLEITFDVPERYLSQLKNKLEVKFKADAFPDKQFLGNITYVAPTVTEGTRTIRSKATLANANGHLKPGLFGHLDLILDKRENSVVIPEACIQYQNGVTLVIAIDKEGKAVFKPVRLGKRMEGQVEILDGLIPGELVVVEGGQKIGPGTTIMAAPESIAYGVKPGPLNQITPAEIAKADTPAKKSVTS